MFEEDMKDQGGKGPSKSKLAQADEMELQTIGFEDVNDTMDPEENARKAHALAEQKKAEEEKKQ
jgi:hypothetical protein